ncbi:MAG TPA: UDP-glucose 4-epimerase GalE [Bryobacteraceae bacterium]|jgi:UDP-glucose-4-epimerase GalE
MKSILVTGGAGYIGSHTAKALAKAGYQPIVYDNLSKGHRWAVQWGPLVVGDLSNRALLRETMQAHDVSAVMHFASHIEVGESMTNPFKYLHANVDASLHLLEAMQEAGVRHIVFSSTAAIYGDPVQVPMVESHPQAPVNPYGEAKRFVERSLHWYAQAHGLSWTALRYFNASGADPEGQIGEQHDPESHLIPRIIYAALGKQKAISIFGTDYPTPDGTAVRDYIHVVDLADVHLKAIERLASGGESIALNLGTGHGHSVREVIASVERVSGRKVPVVEAPRRAGDPPVLVADSTLAQQILSWTPQHAAIDDIVGTAWKWHTRPAGPS